MGRPAARTPIPAKLALFYAGGGRLGYRGYAYNELGPDRVVGARWLVAASVFDASAEFGA